MSNQWRRQPLGIDSQTLVIGIVIIGIIGYLFIPNFFKSINSGLDPIATATSLNSVNPPNTSDPNPLNSSSDPVQTSPSVNNTLDNGNGNSKLSTGYWILSVSNGAFQQFSVSAQVYTFLQGLINSDSKGTPVITVFLINNGQIRQYIVSNEIYSVISNMTTIDTRASNTSPSSASSASPSSALSTSPGSSPNTSPSSAPSTSSSSSPDVLP